MSNVQAQIAQVAEFMKVGGQQINTTPTFVSYGVAKLRHSLINEEITGKNEFQYCVERDDLVGALDGMCDILYVTYGAALAFGTKIDSTRTAPSVAAGTLAPAHITERTVSSLSYDLGLFLNGFKYGHMTHINESLTKIVRTIFDYATDIKVDLAGAFNEVHESNMSKFSPTEEHAWLSAKTRFKEGDGKYGDVYVTSVDVDGKTYWMIKRNEDGKILKSLNFFEPDLSKFVK